MRKKYFIQQYTQQEYLHGGVGATDAEKILSSLEFTPVSFPHHFSFSLKAKFSRLFRLMRMIFSVKRKSIILFLFPVYARMDRLLLRFLRMKGVKLICIIADIEGIRDADQELLKTETRQLKRCRHFIVHTNKMRLLVEQLVPGSICSILYFFDFLAPQVNSQRLKSNDIVFAGNLGKSRFLLSLNHTSFSNLHFNLYGPGVSQKILAFKNISYYGVSKPYDMPSIVQGSFGLIWDGESIDNCSGIYGEYVRYNSQHKLSLYILSGLPVVIWEEAATAELVKEYNIGFTVKSLHEIGSKIKALTGDDYLQMQTNMRPLAEKISKGEFLSKAVDEMMKRIETV